VLVPQAGKVLVPIVPQVTTPAKLVLVPNVPQVTTPAKLVLVPLVGKNILRPSYFELQVKRRIRAARLQVQFKDNDSGYKFSIRAFFASKALE
jgi:hypothetical protein